MLESVFSNANLQDICICILAQIQLKTPVVSCQANGTRIEFKCQITPTGRVAMYYEVNWYQRPIGNIAAKLVKTETLSGANYASFIKNSDHVRLFRLGGNVSKIIIMVLFYGSHPSIHTLNGQRQLKDDVLWLSLVYGLRYAFILGVVILGCCKRR